MYVRVAPKPIAYFELKLWNFDAISNVCIVALAVWSADILTFNFVETVELPQSAEKLACHMFA